jgi:hypothetical protein
MCALYSLSSIQSNMGFYMTFGYFSAEKSKAIWEEINKLCLMIRPHALALVEVRGDTACWWLVRVFFSVAHFHSLKPYAGVWYPCRIASSPYC